MAVAGPGDGLSPQPLAVPWALSRPAGLPRLRQRGAGAGSVLELALPPVAVHTNEVAIPAPCLCRVLPHKHLLVSGNGSRLRREVPGGWVVRGAASRRTLGVWGRVVPGQGLGAVSRPLR